MPPKREYDDAGSRTEALDEDWQDAEALAAELAGEPEPEPEPALRPASVPHPEFSDGDPRDALRTVGARREAARLGLAGAELELWAAITKAHAAGVPKLTIAKDAGVSRQTVYNVLAKEAGAGA